jgi:Uma2 family endonuclease
MAVPSDRHNRVVVNLVLALGPLAREKGCRLYASDMRLKVDAATVYYPDLMVICEEDAGEHYKEKPCLVIEVLSESTEATDRREKLRKYLVRRTSWWTQERLEPSATTGRKGAGCTGKRRKAACRYPA